MKNPASQAPRLKERRGGAESRMQQSVIRLPEGLGTVEWFARVVPKERSVRVLSVFPF